MKIDGSERGQRDEHNTTVRERKSEQACKAKGRAKQRRRERSFGEGGVVS